MTVATAVLLLCTALVESPHQAKLFVDPVRAHQRFLTYSSEAPEARIQTLWLAQSYIQTYARSVERHPAYAPCIQLQHELVARFEKSNPDSMSKEQVDGLRDFMNKSYEEIRRLDEEAREPVGKVSLAMCGALRIAFLSPDQRERKVAEQVLAKILPVCYEPDDSISYGCIVPPKVNQVRDEIVSDFARSVARRRPEWFAQNAQQDHDFLFISLCLLAETRHPSANPLFEKALTVRDSFDLDHALQAAALWPRSDWLAKLMELAKNPDRAEDLDGRRLGWVLAHAKRDGARALLASVRKIPISLLLSIGYVLDKLPYPETIKVLDLMSKSKDDSLRYTGIYVIDELFNPSREPGDFWNLGQLSRQDWELATQITRRLVNDPVEGNRQKAANTLGTLNDFGFRRGFVSG
jgi:hypothetical protein